MIENWTKCFLCGQSIRISVSQEEIESAPRLPFSILNIHGNPPHGIIIYVDRKAFVRGQEHVDKIEMTDELRVLIKSKKWASPLVKSLL